MFLLPCNELPWNLFVNYLIGQFHLLGFDKNKKRVTRPDYQAIFLVINELVTDDVCRVDVLDKLLLLFEVDKQHG